MASPGIARYWPFWVYLFSVAALIGLVLAGPKLIDRQRAIESAAVKREAVASGNASAAVAAEARGPIVPLWPIYLALVVAAIVSGGFSLLRVLSSRGAPDAIDPPPPMPSSSPKDFP